MIKYLILALLLVGCSKESLESQRDTENRLERERRVWHRTPKGVQYFYECIDGVRFIATPSTHGATQLAGPLGECRE